MLNRHVCFGLLSFLCLLAGLQARIEVRDPTTRWVELDEIDGRWLEIELPVIQRGKPEVAGSRIELELLLPARGAGVAAQTLFVSGEAQLLGLFQGDRKVLFYLPVEVIEHYGIERRMIAWRLKLNEESRVGGASHERVEALLSEGKGASGNVRLARIYETPFYSENYPEKLAASPAYVR